MAAMPPHIATLLRPGALPDAPDGAELLQTHGSYVLLGRERVYKLKKPLDLGFLNYSTLERRRAACEAEVRLNRRLSDGVYLGVQPITGEGSDFHLGGEGKVVDYAVVMRRLPAAEMMDARVAAGRVTLADIDRLVARLVPFYRAAATGGAIDRAGEPDALLMHWQENFAQTLGYCDRTLSGETFHRTAALVYRDIVQLRPDFARRVRDGRIRDGHGDLRLSAICLSEPIQVLDCIEFDDSYRFGDVAADIAFLATDLDAHGRADLASALIDRFVAASGDDQLRAVLPFYCCYRAYVRGKVDSMLLDEPETPAAQKDAAAASARRRFAQALAYSEHGRQ